MCLCYFRCVCVFCPRVYMCTACVPGPRGGQKALTLTELELQMGCESPWGCLELKLDCLQEQRVLSATEPSLQPPCQTFNRLYSNPIYFDAYYLDYTSGYSLMTASVSENILFIAFWHWKAFLNHPVLSMVATISPTSPVASRGEWYLEVSVWMLGTVCSCVARWCWSRGFYFWWLLMYTQSYVCFVSLWIQ